MNVGDVAIRVRRTFGDEASIQIQDADIIRWVNDGQEDIVLKNEGLMEATAVANSVAGTSDYNVPTDMSVLRSLKYNSNTVQPMNKLEFDMFTDGYNLVNGQYQAVPEVFTVWNGVISLFPTPSQSITNGITIFYIKHPASVGTLGDSLTVPLEYHNAVVDFCLKQAYEMDEDVFKANIKGQEFDTKLQKLSDRNKWIAQQEYPSISRRPDDNVFDVFGGTGGYYY